MLYNRIDIRQSTIEQWKELIEDLNILKNIENLQQLKLEIIDNKYKLLDKQDFV